MWSCLCVLQFQPSHRKACHTGHTTPTPPFGTSHSSCTQRNHQLTFVGLMHNYYHIAPKFRGIVNWPLVNFCGNKFCRLKIAVSHVHLWLPHAQFSVTVHSCDNTMPSCSLSIALGWWCWSRALLVFFAEAHQLHVSFSLGGCNGARRKLENGLCKSGSMK